jgi:hypothetical protein
MYISCDRQAFYSKAERNLRITFDDNIVWRSDNLNLCAPIYGSKLLEKGYCIMEIKCIDAMPLWLVKALTVNKIYNTSFSKYANAYIAYLTSSRILNNRTKGGKEIV